MRPLRRPGKGGLLLPEARGRADRAEVCNASDRASGVISPEELALIPWPCGEHFHFVAVAALCLAAAPAALAYGWPLKPFHKAHPIRGNFGDPRTIFSDPFQPSGVFGGCACSFHNGLDIAGVPGQAVYPVVSGVARVPDLSAVTVRASRGRVFKYMHITPTVYDGQRVTAYKTVIGHIDAVASHVHFSEIDNTIVINPLGTQHLQALRRPHQAQRGLAAAARAEREGLPDPRGRRIGRAGRAGVRPARAAGSRLLVRLPRFAGGGELGSPLRQPLRRPAHRRSSTSATRCRSRASSGTSTRAARTRTSRASATSSTVTGRAISSTS